MNENLCICPFFKDRLSVDTQKSGPKEGDVCRGIDCYTLTWHDLEPNMLDEQLLVPIANLNFCFELNLLYLAGLFE